MKRILTAAILSLFVSGPAFAGTCPLMVKGIDAALAAMPDLSAEKTAEVKSLRDEGDAQHQAGQHAESVETLQKAKDILGL
ncbi:MAG: hypothetical protein V3T57_08210 [Kiloniellales bacterium]|jgi:outer membrane lipoprotein-sorting protein